MGYFYLPATALLRLEQCVPAVVFFDLRYQLLENAESANAVFLDS